MTKLQKDNKVTSEVFHKKLSTRSDVVLSLEKYEGNTYMTIYKNRHGRVLGKIVPILNELGREKCPIENSYFLRDVGDKT